MSIATMASRDHEAITGLTAAGLAVRCSDAGQESSTTSLSSERGAADAMARQQQRIRFLRLGGEQHRRLAEKLRSCGKGHRCKSEADPVCVWLLHRKLCQTLDPLLAARSWTIANVVTTGLLVPYGRLAHRDLTQVVARLRRQLERSSLGDRIVVGSIDLSVAAKDQRLIGWQLFMRLLIEGKSGDQLHKAVQKAFPPEPKSLKPYLFKDVTDTHKALGDIYTTKFYRKAEYRLRKKLHVAKLPLTGADLKELLSFLARYRVGTRLLLNGIDRSGGLLNLRIDNGQA